MKVDLLTLVVVILLVFLLVGFLPTWSYTNAWGTGWLPSSAAGLVLLIVLILVLLGRI